MNDARRRGVRAVRVIVGIAVIGVAAVVWDCGTCVFRGFRGPYTGGSSTACGRIPAQARPLVTASPAEGQMLAIGSGFACAVRADRSVACWGSNMSGQLGDGTTRARCFADTVAGVSDASSVSAGSDHACALRRDGSIQCWGSARAGTLGRAIGRPWAGPVTVPGITDAVEIAAGFYRTCARLASGRVRCWGRVYRPSREGEALLKDVPVDVPGLSGATALAAGGMRTCGLRSDGTIRCFDAAEHIRGSWQLQIPYSGPAIDGLRPVQMSVGASFVCVRREDGAVGCLGSNEYGELAREYAELGSSDSLVPIREVSGADDVAAGFQHGCALARGRVTCWGVDGRMGNLRGERPAAEVPGLEDAVELTAGHQLTCAIRADHTVVCWGDTGGGRAGDGTSVRVRSSPSAPVLDARPPDGTAP